jgi:GntR family transcriptional regulator
MALIDRDSPIPYYFQLKRLLLAKIRNHEWKAGALIPSEHELEQQYQVSRTTIRQTLGELVNEGYLVRRRGRGTFIAQPTVLIDSTRRFDLKEYNPHEDGPMEWRMIDMQSVEAPPQVREALMLHSGDQVMRLRRLRTAGQAVLGYHIAYIPPQVATYIDEQNLTMGEPLTYLRNHPLMERALMERIVAATLADKFDLEFLDIKRNAPILYLERTVKAEEGTPLEFMIARFRGDRFKFRLTDS